MPTSTFGFSSSIFTASGNHGDGTITSIERSIPSLKVLINAWLPLWENPISSPRTINLIVLDWAWLLINANIKNGKAIFLSMSEYLGQANKIPFFALSHYTGRQKNTKNKNK